LGEVTHDEVVGGGAEVPDAALVVAGGVDAAGVRGEADPHHPAVQPERRGADRTTDTMVRVRVRDAPQTPLPSARHPPSPWSMESGSCQRRRSQGRLG